MFRLTPNLKRFAQSKLSVPATASDAEFIKAIGKAIAAKKVTLKAVQAAAARQPVAAGAVPPNPTLPAKPVVTQRSAPATARLRPVATRAAAPTFTMDDVNRLLDAKLKEVTTNATNVSIVNEKSMTPAALFGKAAGQVMARVKSAAERYKSNRTAAICPNRCGHKGQGSLHPLAGQPAIFSGVALDMPSDRDKAVALAYFKWSLATTAIPQDIPVWAKMTDHDRDLVQWAIRNEKWSGYLGGRNGEVEGTRVYRRMLLDLEIKTLLDDSTSGGTDIAPIVFDDAIVLLPVLYGELFPNVNLKTLTRGRQVVSGLMNQPTFTSNATEATTIVPFTTTGFISAFNTNVMTATGAMEIGLDFEEDSPVDVGGNVIEYYGLKAMEYLDRVIANGNGTTEPLGIFNTPGVVTNNSDMGAAGPLTVSDFEGLMFGLTKAYRAEPGAYPCYISNDQGYRKARGIAVGTGDQRRVFGMDHAGYQILETPYKVQNDIPNGKYAYANLRRYRMYRRLGLTVRIETAGRTLALSNTKIIVVRMRYGGQLETGGAAAIMTDGAN